MVLLLLKKCKNRKGDPAGRRAQFESSTVKLWDIAAVDPIKQIRSNRMLRKEEREIDVKFYLDQRSERKGHIPSNDKVFAQTVQKNKKRQVGKHTRELSSKGKGLQIQLKNRLFGRLTYPVKWVLTVWTRNTQIRSLQFLGLVPMFILSTFLVICSFGF